MAAHACEDCGNVERHVRVRIQRRAGARRGVRAVDILPTTRREERLEAAPAGLLVPNELNQREPARGEEDVAQTRPMHTDDQGRRYEDLHRLRDARRRRKLAHRRGGPLGAHSRQQLGVVAHRAIAVRAPQNHYRPGWAVAVGRRSTRSAAPAHVVPDERRASPRDRRA